MFMMEPIKFIPLTISNSNIKTYVKVDNIIRLSEVEDKTYVYTTNNTAPFVVKESVGDILAKIGAVAWNTADKEE